MEAVHQRLRLGPATGGEVIPQFELDGRPGHDDVADEAGTAELHAADVVAGVVDHADRVGELAHDVVVPSGGALHLMPTTCSVVVREPDGRFRGAIERSPKLPSPNHHVL